MKVRSPAQRAAARAMFKAAATDSRKAKIGRKINLPTDKAQLRRELARVAAAHPITKVTQNGQ